MFSNCLIMLREHATRRGVKTQTGRRGTKFPGIVAAARDLGVSRIHLYYVLIGERESKRIEGHPIFRVLQSKGRAA